MCGIAGFVGPDDLLDDGQVAAMAGAIRFRGRDGEGTWRDRGIALLHSRLAVLDPAGGAQPMADSSGRFVIVFSGEVHNFEELRRSYAREGATFRTGTDTEVVVEGFRLHGAAVCDDFVGMYAFAIWDTVERQLFLARDRIGEKPLHWYAHGGGIWFASSCDAFARLPGWRGGLGPEGVAQFAAMGTFRGSTTIYEQAHSLPPASFALVVPGDTKVRPQSYWHIDMHHRDLRSEDELEEAYVETLTRAVEVRLRSDVPLVVTFSGGVDSGSVAAVASRRLGRSVPCLTLDYDTAESPSEEVARARDAAERLDVPWTFEHYDYRSTFVADLVSACRWFDQPTAHLEIAQIERIARLIRPRATVALTGNGADELFLGYIGDERLRRLDALTRHVPRVGPGRGVDPVRRLRARLLRQAGEAGFADPSALEPTLDQMQQDADASGVHRSTQLKMFHGLTWGAVDANVRLPDIAGLSAQVEFRSPFLDHRLVELAATLPDAMKIRSPRDPRGNKWIAKRCYERYVGPDLSWAGKLNNGGNLRWDRQLATDPGCVALVARAHDALDAAGYPSAGARQAWVRYREDVIAGRPPATWQSTFRGLMLGVWLSLRS